jgi:hypothetical protein
MLYQYLRVFRGTNGALTDLSIENQDESINLDMVLTAGTDYLYLAKSYPFNNFFLQINTANTTSSNIKIEYLSNKNTWVQAVDTLDGTKLSGKTLARSGVVQFTPDQDNSWIILQDTSDNNSISDLTSLILYNLYWIRLSFSTTPSASTSVKTISYAFTTSPILDNLEISINKFLPSFGTGKTDWNNEIMTASQHVVEDLKTRGIILSEGQILRLDDVSLPTSYKTLVLIMASLGKGFEDKRDYYEARYKEYISKINLSLDKNSDGILSRSELHTSQVRMER